MDEQPAGAVAGGPSPGGDARRIEDLLEILACPDTHHAPLRHDPAAQTLTCAECGRIFPIRDGIPVLLLDEAIAPEGTR